LFIRLTRRIGAAAVVVTHDLASFARIADRALMLGGERDGDQQGRVIVQGGKEAFAESDHPLVRRFLGSSADCPGNGGNPAVLPDSGADEAAPSIGEESRLMASLAEPQAAEASRPTGQGQRTS
jgi:ABC-type sulfate/molybdate transport systems ATPase subunit